MPSHTVSGNTDTTGVQLRKSTEDSLWQFLSDIAIHVVAIVIGSLGGIDIKASAGAKIISIILALNVKTTLSAIVSISCLLQGCLANNLSMKGYDVRGLVSGYSTAMPF